LGTLAGNLQTNSFNTFVGARAGLSSTGERNTFVGAVSLEVNVANYGCGELMTTGSKNTILGGFNGNQGGLDIRTASNYIVLSDGDGNPLISTADNQTVALEGAVPNAGTGITFPATQSASSNANTLDDYEEGTFTAAISTASGTVSTTSTTGYYTKIGNQVSVRGYLNVSAVSSPSGSSSITGLPFTSTGSYVAATIYLVSLTSGATTSVQAYVQLDAAFITIVIYNAGARVEAGPYFQAGAQVMYSATYNV